MTSGVMNIRPYIYLFFISLFLFLMVASPCASAQEEKVLVVEISDSITSASDDLVTNAISVAEEENYDALLITLNTPGGKLDETFNIIEQIEGTDVPVIGYVYPEGAKSWSAGTIILISTDIAAMAPFSVIGSAQPVQLTGTGSQPINDTKTINAIIEYTREKARQNNRNVTAAEEFITKNLNLNAETAQEYNVIEYVSPSIGDLLRQVDGDVAKGKQLNVSGAQIDSYDPPLNIIIMGIISDPLIASLLLIIGLYSIVIGLSNPGFGAEIFGTIAIALGLIGSGFDVNIAAIFLIIVGMGLIFLEIQSPGIGAFGVGGLICLIAGSIFLIPTDYPDFYTPAEIQQEMIIAIVTPSIIMGVFMLFIVYKIIEVRHKKPIIGEMIGGTAITNDQLKPNKEGYVKYKGEYWKARSDEYIEKNVKVKIIEKDGPVLVVKRVEG
ncbi:MAG: NfeD family protein [Methanohalobium sp.]|uniref:NfeD family protein n=1 Tax=Methanohalobium sp. TaxID=2837493 RepID=UPI00397A2A41